MFLAYALASLLAIAAAWRLDFSFVNNDAQSQLAKQAESADSAQAAEQGDSIQAQRSPQRDDRPHTERQHSVHAADVWEREPGADALLQASTVPFEGVEHESDARSERERSASAAEEAAEGSVEEPLLASTSGRAAQSAAAGMTFRQRYATLLSDPRMLIFLSKALVMGVRSRPMRRLSRPR